MIDSDVLNELMNTLADARAALLSALLQTPDSDWALKDAMVCTIRDIDLVRLTSAEAVALDKGPS
jgi:hypothetical protein